jgi:hypothetical protein
VIPREGLTAGDFVQGTESGDDIPAASTIATLARLAKYQQDDDYHPYCVIK